ncbi:hypothetical protein LJC20_06470 [Eubacteriales bacterium OttesenSCG-928-M02]|nr:hypothetical protein [Eubacteriales bacterium OttesenSCG-928-M02]
MMEMAKKHVLRIVLSIIPITFLLGCINKTVEYMGSGNVGNAIGYFAIGCLLGAAMLFAIWKRVLREQQMIKKILRDTGFVATQNIKGERNTIYVDARSKLWYCNTTLPRIYRFDEVKNAELVEIKEGTSTAKGVVGRSAVGGLLGGATGAIIGGSTSKRTIRTKVVDAKIRVHLNSVDMPMIEISGFVKNAPRVTSLINRFVDGK